MEHHDHFDDTLDHVKHEEEKFEDSLEEAKREIEDLADDIKTEVNHNLQVEGLENEIKENGEMNEGAAAEETCAGEAEEESFEQVNYGGTTMEQPFEHHIHGEDEPLKQVNADLDEEPPSETNLVDDIDEAENRATGEAEAEEEQEVAAQIIEPAEGQFVEQEAEAEAEEQVKRVDEAAEEYAEAAEEEKDENKTEDRQLGDGDIDIERFEEVPAEIVAPVGYASAVDEKEPEKPSIESEIFNVFKLFDYETNETININDLGNVLRCMQLNPTEADVKALTEELETDGSKISWSDFLPKVVDIIETEKFKPATEDELITAFSLLDTDKKGFLTIDQLKTALLKLGEPLNEEEFEEMLATASDFDAECFNYVEYAKLLVCT